MTRSSPPTKRLGRFLRLAEAGARSGGALLNRRGTAAAARHAADVLGDLRGLAAKVGQMASYVDGFLPEAQRETYQRALARLQASAMHTPAHEAQRIVESELGRPIDVLFETWEAEPFASASIGQVHRAVLPGGGEVAVKVQHSGIERAVESDLANMGLLQSLVSGIGPKSLDAKAIYEVIRERFREELDYRLEASNVSFFAELHRDEPRIRIPRVITSHSGRRVLTTELARGLPLDEAALQPEGTRRQYAELLWRFAFKGKLVAGRFNADPHPGNYIFHTNGSISFIDFGCVQRLEPAHLQQARHAHLSALARDEAGFARNMAALRGTRGGTYERKALAYSRRCFEPLFASPFHLDRAYVTDLTAAIMALKREMFAKDGSFVQLAPSMVFLERLQFGFYSVLARLDVLADYASVEHSFLSISRSSSES